MGHKPSATAEGYRPHSVDALRPFLERIEAWIQEQAGVQYLVLLAREIPTKVPTFCWYVEGLPDTTQDNKKPPWAVLRWLEADALGEIPSQGRGNLLALLLPLLVLVGRLLLPLLLRCRIG